MTIAVEGFEGPAEQLSALADGELDAASVADACAHWLEDSSVRQRWHGYQLIGDVLRSDDLASTAAHDSAFLSALRRRLEREPVVLAPAALRPPFETVRGLSTMERSRSTVDARNRRRWTRAGAIAAGFVVVVAGALTFNRPPAPAQSLAVSAPQPSVLAVAAPAQTVAPVLVQDRDGSAASEPQALVASGNLVRDARLDRYLAAHQQWSGGSVIGGHAAFLRHVVADAPKR